jgi:DNA-binding transcriptional LysR family regulator
MDISYIHDSLYVWGNGAMSFTFRQLEVFVEAAQDCNFRQTADRLGISQPSISNQIRVLERWTGGELFHRSRGSTPRLTAQGITLLGGAQALLAGKRRLVAEENTRARKERQRIRIAAGPYLLERYIRPALPQFLERHDEIVLDFLPPGTSKPMGRAVRSGDADIAVFTGSRSVRNLVGAEFLCETPCSLYGSTRLARLAANAPSTVASLPFILPPEGSDLERWLLRALRKAGISPRNVTARSQFADVIGDMVTSDKGVSVLFDEQMAPHVRSGRAARLAPAIECGSRVMLIGQRARGRAVAPLLDFLRHVLKRETAAVRTSGEGSSRR